MTVDDEIRAALREDAGESAPPDGGWDDVRRRADAHTRRQRAVRYPIVGVAAAAAVALVVVGIAALRSTSESKPPSVATPVGLGMPDEIVAEVGDRLVVIDSETGAELRTLVQGTQGRMSSDGRYVYFVRPDDRACDPMTFEIARVSIDGGSVDVVARGLAPSVSPDGRFLAYTSYGEGDFPNCVRERFLVIRELATGNERQYFASEDGETPPRAVPVSWTADSEQLLYGINSTSEGEYFFFEVGSASGALDSSNSIKAAIPVGDTVPLGVTADRSILVRTMRETAELAIVDPQSGEILRRVLELKGRDVLSTAVDPSGRHVVFAPVSPSSAALPLERLTLGEKVAVRLQTSAIAVAWIPDRAPSPPPTTTPATTPEATPTTTPAPSNAGPETIVAVIADGRVVELDASTGAERRVIRSAPEDGSQYETVSVGPGSLIAVSRIRPSDDYCSTFESGQIQLVNRETGGVETVGQGRYPALSPDGKRLGWVGYHDCIDRLNVLDLERRSMSVLQLPPSSDGGPDPQLSGPITWAPDSRHLMIPVNVEPFRDWWYVDADVPDGGALSGAVIKQRGEQGGPFAMAFASSSVVAAVVADPADGANLRIQFLDVTTGAETGGARILTVQGELTIFEIHEEASSETYLVVGSLDGERILYRIGPGAGFGPLATGIRSADW
jgi:hypothetical protein